MPGSGSSEGHQPRGHVRIAALPGDGVGAEVLAGPISLLEGSIAREFPVEVCGPWPVGASALALGEGPLPEATLSACSDSDAILLGAIGDHPGVATEAGLAEGALLRLRAHFDLRVSIREIWGFEGPRLVVLRNLLGGAYGPQSVRIEGDELRAASDRIELEASRVAELAHLAMELNDIRPGWTVVSVDKANLWATSRLWRNTVEAEFSVAGRKVEHMLVDRSAYELAADKLDHVVLLTEGIFGDILSDLACGRAGSIALCGSASVNPDHGSMRRCVGLFEPVHGSAPRRFGQNVVNPTGAYLALAAALERFTVTRPAADRLRSAVKAALARGPRTYDLARPGEQVASCSQFAQLIKDAYECDAAVRSDIRSA